MASTYSTNLRLELIGTGEQQGTWGSTTNTNLGTLLEEAIGGYTAVAMSDAGDTTLTTANGAVDQSRNMTLNLTGTLTNTRNLISPAIEKIYIVKNSTSGGFAVTVKVSGQTGVSIPNGATFVLYVDGTDVRQATGSVASGGTGASTAAGAATNLGLGTTDSPQFAGVNIGNASDTTITRSSGGVIAVEGGVIPKENRANTFSANQIISITDNTNAALRVTQLGSGEAIRVEDTTNPDSSPFVVDAAGNVGIGTASPNAPLVIEGGSSSNQMRMGTGSNYYQIGRESVSTGFLVFYGSQTGATGYAFGGIDGERMRIDSIGNVGIGTTSMSKKFVVSNAGATSLEIDPFGRSGETATSLLSYNRSGAAFVAAHYDALNHQFYTSTSLKMTLDAGGNVGIGTTPGEKFHVSGNALIQPISGAALYLRNLTSTNRIDSYNYPISATYPLIVNASDIKLQIADSTKLQIDSSGNVSIGSDVGDTLQYLDVANSNTGSNAGSIFRLISSNAAGSGNVSADIIKYKNGSFIIANNETDAAASMIFTVGASERFRITSSGNVLVTSSGGLGYGTGSGGTVTQITSRTTGVTLNKTNGSITLFSAPNSTTFRSFTVTNSTVAATDVILLSQRSGTNIQQLIVSNVAAGSFAISHATTTGTVTEAPIINFTVIKAVNA